MSPVSTASSPFDRHSARLPWHSAQGVLAALAFANLIVCSNAMHPLLPMFRQTLGLDPLETSLTFVSYVGMLCLVLLVLSQPRLVRWSPLFLCAALVVVMLGDVVLARPSIRGLMLGRTLTGLAGGLGTGSASALVVTALGARGRAISATGNLAGAVVGVSLTELCILVYGHHAAAVTFLGHAAVSLVLLVILVPVLVRNRAMNRAALTSQGSVRLRSLAPVVRRQWVLFSIGCLSWLTISLAVSLLPSFFAELGGPGPAIAIGIIAYLLSSSLGQIFSASLARIAPWLSGLVAMVAGAVLVACGAVIGHPLVALLGFPVLGFGTGLAYRLSLVVLTRGSTPARQGALASLYGAVTYGASTFASLTAGLMGNLVGLRSTVITIFLIIAFVSAWLTGRAPRLRDNREG